ncbi:MAG: M48 family metallopeptidase [Candidatus Nitrospinota bacterium M3_3B_026]
MRVFRTRWLTGPALFLAFFLALPHPGCRTVPETGRTQLALIDVQTEKRLGADAYKEIIKDSKVVADPRLNAILQRVGRRIAEASRQPGFEWEFALIEKEAPNAFCLPGGKMAAHTGILPIAKNEAGLAAVIGHEVAHAVARHGAERMSQGILVALAGELLAQGLTREESDRQLFRMAYGVGTAVAITLPFSRRHELEADYLGLLYMARAGYDPREAERFWRRFSDWAKEKGAGSKIEFLSTHPTDERRISQIRGLLPRALEESGRSGKLGLGEEF